MGFIGKRTGPRSAVRVAAGFHAPATGPRKSAVTPATAPVNVDIVTDFGGGLMLIQVNAAQYRAKRLARLAGVGRFRAKPSAAGQAAEFGARSGAGTTALSDAAGTLPEANRLLIGQLAAQERATWHAFQQNGQLLGSADIQARMGVTRQALSLAVHEGRMFTIDGSNGAQLYPAFFADPNIARRDVQLVSKQLGRLPGPSKWGFFTRPKLSLRERTPLAALASGELDAVLKAAASYKEHLLGR